MIATGVLGTGRKTVQTQTPPIPLPGRSSSVLSSLGLPFDPYDHTPLPSRIITTGAAANFPSVANLVGDVFNASVFVPNTQVDSAQVVPHRNAPVQGYPSRAAIGSAYVARWVWGKERGAQGGVNVGGRGLGGFEDEMRRLLGKRWVATGGVPLKTNINGAGSINMASGLGLGIGSGGSGANSGTSTPFGPRSGLGATIFVEEDEDEVEEMERNGGLTTNNAGIIGTGGGVYGNTFLDSFGASRLRTHTGSTADTTTSIGSGPIPSTAYTTPDLNLGITSPGLNGNGLASATTPTTPTPLTPVVALPTADAEAQIGLAKVAEPDTDAFMTYAAIVPEFCRLENMLVKGLV